MKDTKFERTTHEATGRHQGNLKRFLRGIQNDHEKDERDKQRAKSEVERLNMAVGGGSSSSPRANTQSFSNAAPASASQVSIADRKRQMAQLADLGIAIPDQYRGQMALAGEWQVVSQKPVEPGEQAEKEPLLSVGVRKRKLECQEEEQEASQTLKKKGWGTTTKEYPSQSKQDLEALFAGSIHFKKENPNSVLKEEDSYQLVADDQGCYKASVDNDVLDTKDEIRVKREDVSERSPSPGQLPDQAGATTEGAAEAPGIVFKKRKSKSARPK